MANYYMMMAIKMKMGGKKFKSQKRKPIKKVKIPESKKPKDNDMDDEWEEIDDDNDESDVTMIIKNQPLKINH